MDFRFVWEITFPSQKKNPYFSHMPSEHLVENTTAIKYQKKKKKTVSDFSFLLYCPRTRNSGEKSLTLQKVGQKYWLSRGFRKWKAVKIRRVFKETEKKIHDFSKCAVQSFDGEKAIIHTMAFFSTKLFHYHRHGVTSFIVVYGDV